MEVGTTARQSLAHEVAEGLSWAIIILLAIMFAAIPVSDRLDGVDLSLSFGATGLSAVYVFLHWKLLAKRNGLKLLAGFALFTVIKSLIFFPGFTADYLTVVLQGTALIALAIALSNSPAVRQYPLLRRGIPLVASLFFLSYASCFNAIEQTTSFPEFIRGAALHFAVFLLTTVVLSQPKRRLMLFRLFAGIGGVWIIASMVVAVMFILSGTETRLSMQSHRFVRDFVAFRGDHHFRLQFPFFHHNSLALYALLAGFSALVASRMERATPALIAWKSVFAFSLGVLILSTTRGAWAAAATGVAVYYAASPGIRTGLKTLLITILTGIALFFAFEPFQQRVQSTVDRETYQSQRSTWVLRLHAYEAAFEMGLAHPLTGVGPGPASFQQIYRRDYLRRFKGDIEIKQHAHNDALEFFAESGVLAAGCFALWMGLIGARLWRSRKKEHWIPAGCAAWAAIAVYGLTNVTFFFLTGTLTWVLFAMISSLIGRNQTETPSR